MKAGKIIRKIIRNEGYVLLENEHAVSEAYRSHFIPPQLLKETSVSRHTAAKLFEDGHVHLVGFVCLPPSQGFSWGDGRQPVIVRLRLDHADAKYMPLDTFVGLSAKELTKRMKAGKSMDAVLDEVQKVEGPQQVYVPIRGARIRSAGLGLTVSPRRVARLG